MKKILSIVALCLIAILAGTIIVFSCVDKSYNLNLTNPDYILVSVDNQADKISYEKNDSEYKEVYNKILNLYNESFKQKIMSGIFSGTIFSKTKLEYNNSVQPISNLLSSGTYIVFGYDTKNVLKLNGKNYTYKYPSGSTGPSTEYQKLYIEVKNSETITTFNIYAEAISSDTVKYSYYHYEVKAKQCDLYEYLQELVKE